MKERQSAVFVVVVMLLLAGCSGDEHKAELMKMSADALYAQAIKDVGSNDDAIKKLDVLIQVYPQFAEIEKAHILKAYVYFKNGKFDDAVMAVDEYSEQYKHSPNLAYMQYLRAMCYYEQLVDEGRDQKMTYDAMQALQGIMTDFPDTQYAQDAKWKYDYAFNLLAGKEVMLGRFYLKQHNMVGAINRFKAVLDLYETSMFTPEALYRMCEAYTALGVTSEATTYAAVLAANFPNSIWHVKAYNLLHANLQYAHHP